MSVGALVLGVLNGLTVQLLHGKRVVASAHVRRVGTVPHQVVLHPRHGRAFARGRYELVVRKGRHVLARRPARAR